MMIEAKSRGGWVLSIGWKHRMLLYSKRVDFTGTSKRDRQGLSREWVGARLL